MGRKVEIVRVPTGDAWRENRDSAAARVYRLTEMDSVRAEKWGTRALLLLKNSGARIPDNVQGLGMIGVAIVGLNVFLQGNISFEDLEPLMDEMMTCVEIVRDPRHPDVVTPLASADDVEEVQTRLWLRSEVLRLHTGFSPADALSRLISAATSSAGSSNTPTSPPA